MLSVKINNWLLRATAEKSWRNWLQLTAYSSCMVEADGFKLSSEALLHFNLYQKALNSSANCFNWAASFQGLGLKESSGLYSE